MVPRPALVGGRLVTRLGAPLLVLACGSNGSDAADPDASAPDGGAPDVVVQPDAAPPTTHITVTTARADGIKVDATWAAFLGADGAWHRLEKSAPATYAFDAAGPRWSIAFACDDGKSSTVSTHVRPIEMTAADLVVDDECVPDYGDRFSITGTLANVPATTSWLDFGYPHEARGSVVGLAGANAEYEEINVDHGTWDLAFGLRDDPGGPLTRILLKRAYANAADATLDLDMTPALVPEPKKVDVTGFVDGEDFDLSIVHATGGGANGLAVGPQSASIASLAIHAMWDALPASALAATDRYRVLLRTTSSDGARSVRASFHTAADLTIELPPVLEAPTGTLAGPKVSAHLPAHPGAVAYDAIVYYQPNRETRRAFRLSPDPSFATETLDVVPDLTAVSGFAPSWALPNDQDLVLAARVTEPSAPLGDGMRTRTSERHLTLKR